MLDGTNRVTFQDVYVLTRNDAGVMCGVNGKVVCIPHRRLLPGSDIAAGGAHGTVVLERVFAQVLELLPPESGYRHRPGRVSRNIARPSRGRPAAMTTAPVEQADLPPFTNQLARCGRCGRRGGIRVDFDRDCAEARGDHFHRVCPCGATWVERCRE